MSKANLVREIQKLALVPGLDGKLPSNVPDKTPITSTKSNIPSPVSESKSQSLNSSVSHKISKTDVMAMQNSLLQFVHAGIIPQTGLPDAKFANGVWGPRTNAAINEVISAAQDTLAMINELRNEGININIDVYNLKYLDALKTYVPTLKGGRITLDSEDQSDWARNIEKHLNGIKAMNQQFNVQIGNKGQFRELNGKTLDQYSSSRGLVEINSEIANKVDQYINNRVMIPISIPGITTSMPIIALTSKEQYLNWINDIYKKSPIDEKQAADLFTRVILPQLGKSQQKV